MLLSTVLFHHHHKAFPEGRSPESATQKIGAYRAVCRHEGALVRKGVEQEGGVMSFAGSEDRAEIAEVAHSVSEV